MTSLSAEVIVPDAAKPAKNDCNDTRTRKIKKYMKRNKKFSIRAWKDVFQILGKGVLVNYENLKSLIPL